MPYHTHVIFEIPVAVREHMEGAIGTVLKFTNEDCDKISTQKKTHKAAAWF